MANTGGSFKAEIFRNNQDLVIATHRHTALILPVRLRYDASGYQAGEVLGQNNVDFTYGKYDDNTGASGLNAAKCILMEDHPVEDFDAATAAGSTMAAGIFGQCTVFKDRLTGWDSNAATDLGAKEITDATGTTVIKF